MIQLYTGDGKGKTTAAIGQAVRTLGWGNKVLFAQFLKNFVTGEKKILESLDGLTFIRPEMRHKGFIWNMDQKELSETREDIINGFSFVCRIIETGDFSLAVLDEVLDIIDCGFLSEDSLIKLLDKVPNTEFILTGRKASDLLKEKSDYVSHISKVKHPFDLGIQCRKGIEY